MRVVILGGAGKIGRLIARDLIEGPDPAEEVIVADLDEAAAIQVAQELGSGARAMFCDLLDVDQTAHLLYRADVCINAAQYDFNLQAMQACLEAGVPYLDLGGLFHMTRRQLALDEEFRSRKLLAILGIGSCPGLSNVQAAYLASQLDRVERLRIYNGSLPPGEGEFAWGYSIRTILDELTMRPVVFEEGAFVEKDPLSGEEFYLFREPVGWQKVHLSLHSEVATLPLTYAEKGLRECFFKITFFGLGEEVVRRLKFMADLGLTGQEPVEVPAVEEGGAHRVRVRPRDVLVEVLRRRPTAQEASASGFKDVATEAWGWRGGKPVRLRVDTLAGPHPRLEGGGSAMLVAVPAAEVARWVARGEISQHGVLPPEQVVEPLRLFQALEHRGAWTERTTMERVEI
ncbi:saccharopine dehydrogenase NADP-binding domain-containing protein [Thermoflexus sp.]|uniref:saccharopine dehydrogenase family protein n=1 Tax=Thermoflexus sp. TaxID=1969742 RepID=UPI0025D727F0|nr:saccharopine dehydrogenase NADP-binding domain-containing protein [Thermoflexus sp.]MDW8179686.1 saccharopine dehydrogenase NADP-binding domain-containing protein [Anaerolineae bacterium]MCS6963867.1 saccharopine dehydrogenase NADP-binding domain-containing protein [Thermoflexus sp.]MCS7350235.1 saccharopine dehydrogenase NADP-binding domain-containing protein [Thermoflexus sp.]MCX7691436.1 saccharopine dehydrogenase NADP-binding domain-containing protein [Thermoflexus sp.]MDW8184291.1 sacc